MLKPELIRQTAYKTPTTHSSTIITPKKANGFGAFITFQESVGGGAP